MAGDGYATHLEALAWAFAHTEGPVLELGAGWYSTPMLNGLAEATGRRLVTVEDRLEVPWPTVAPGPDGTHPAEDDAWGLVFVDHGDAARRAESVLRYRGTTVVVHDTEPASAQLYPGLDRALNGFSWQRDFTSLKPWTTVVAPRCIDCGGTGCYSDAEDCEPLVCHTCNGGG